MDNFDAHFRDIVAPGRCQGRQTVYLRERNREWLAMLGVSGAGHSGYSGRHVGSVSYQCRSQRAWSISYRCRSHRPAGLGEGWYGLLATPSDICIWTVSNRCKSHKSAELRKGGYRRRLFRGGRLWGPGDGARGESHVRLFWNGLGFAEGGRLALTAPSPMAEWLILMYSVE